MDYLFWFKKYCDLVKEKAGIDYRDSPNYGFDPMEAFDRGLTPQEAFENWKTLAAEDLV